MISTSLAAKLRDAGLRWRPGPGDAFAIDKPDFTGEVFTVSDMTIEVREFDTGTILGFNGTTEWALDSVALEHALWLPREDQLRALLSATFRSLTRIGDVFRVETAVLGELCRFDASGDAADAYALALLDLMDRTRR